MRTQHYNIKIFTSTILLFILSFVVVFSTPASALEITENVNFSNEYVSPYWHDNNNTTWANGSISYSTNNSAHPSANAIYFRSNNNTNITASVGQYYSFVGTVIATGMSSGQANKSGFFGISTTSTDCPILQLDDVEVEATPQGGNNEQRTVRYTVTGICRVMSAITTGPTINFYVSPTTTSTALATTLQWHNLTKWSADTPLSTINTSISNLSQLITSVNSTLNTMSTTLNNIYTQGEDQLNALNDLRSAQEQANDDANDRYNDEKDTINNSASDAEQNASSQDFNFSIPNPLQSWFGGFSDSECANIPNLAVWLHSEETRVCTPWPASVRTVMTTIVTGLCMLLLFTFIINWVKKNDTGGN